MNKKEYDFKRTYPGIDDVRHMYPDLLTSGGGDSPFYVQCQGLTPTH